MAVSYQGGAITLDNPPANSYDIAFMREMAAAIETATADGSARVVVVRSASEKFFCAGADIKRFLANDLDGNMEMIRLAHEALSRLD
jgi:enoyl-CoA hydratase/carnithine racemase